jgi:hypothetical protein
MPVEPRGLAAHAVFIKKGGRGEMTKTPINLQDLRRRLYVKAKTDVDGGEKRGHFRGEVARGEEPFK